MFTAAVAFTLSPAAADKLSVVVSIAPIHSLVAAVTDGVTEPVLQLRRTASPQAYALSPSNARALQEADLVVWVGPALETFRARCAARRGTAPSSR